MKLFVLVLVALLAAPAAVLAQRDNLKMGEALKASVVKKSEAKELKSQKAPEPQRAREALEIETRKNEVKK